jgi:glycerate kinase
LIERKRKVSITEITASQLQEMFQAGSEHLANNAEYVNSLNVFPVPDGDTGTNMSLSMSTAAKAVADTTKEKASEVASIFAKGLLMGAWARAEIAGLFYRSCFAALLSQLRVSALDLS